MQERVVELGLTTKEKIKKGHAIAGLCILVPNLFFVPAMVYFINGARGFFEIFVQITIILLIVGLFDRLFIDWYWVGKTEAWYIPGTEELKPHIPQKTFIKKWIGTVIGYPLLGAIFAAVMSIVLKGT